MGLFDRISGDCSRDEFAQLFSAALKAAGDPRTAEYDRGAFCFRFTLEGQDAGTTDLQRGYELYSKETPQGRAMMLHMLVHGSLQQDWKLPENPSAALPRLQPRMRRRLDRAVLALTMHAGGLVDDAPWDPYAGFVPLGSHLLLDVVYRTPMKPRDLTTDQLAAWNLDIRQALKVARDNLAKEETNFEPRGSGVFASSVEDGLDDCRILLTDAIEQLPLPGQPVAMIPCAGALLLAGSADATGLARMFGLARVQQMRQESSGVPFLLWWDGNAWQDWLPPLDKPLFASLAAWQHDWWQAAYEQQGEWLEKVHARRNVPDRVVELRVMPMSDAKGGKRDVTVCSWRNTPEPQLLPKTARILLVENVQQVDTASSASWQQVSAAVPELVESTDLYPPRFRVRRFPSPEQLRAVWAAPAEESVSEAGPSDGPETPDWFATSAGDATVIEQIADHVTRHVGPPEYVLHEIVSLGVHLDIHVVPPSERRPYYTLVTSGMSELPMTAPPGSGVCEYAELVLCLPPDWPLGDEDLQDEKNFWPIRMLKGLARFPHENETCLAWDHTLQWDDEERIEDYPSSGVLLARPSLFGDDFPVLTVDDAKQVHFLAVIPLYRSEIEFKLEHGAYALTERLEQSGVNELLDVDRKPIIPVELDMADSAKQPASAPEQSQTTGCSGTLGIIVGVILLVLILGGVRAMIKSGIKQAIISSAPTVEIVVPPGFTGPVWIIEDPMAESLTALEDGRYQVEIPENGVLRVRSAQSFDPTVSRSLTARYEDGTPLPGPYDAVPAGDTIALRPLGGTITVGGGPMRRKFLFYVGTESEAQASSAKPGQPPQ